MGGAPTDNMGRAGWADAATIVPLAVYESYGSTEVLERQLDSMRRWVEHLRRRAGDGVVLPTEPFQYGDWLDPDAPGDRPVGGEGLERLRGERVLRALDAAARPGGAPRRRRRPARRVRRARRPTWPPRRGNAGARRPSRTQTGAALALEFDLAPADRRAEIADGLAADVRAEDGRIATGFLGTPLVLFALSQQRPPRRGVPDAASPRGAVVALPGRPRRDHRVGALGRDPARRQHPRRRHGPTKDGEAACSPSTTTPTAR